MKALILVLSLVFSASFSFASSGPNRNASTNRGLDTALKSAAKTAVSSYAARSTTNNDSTSYTVKSGPKPTANRGRTDGSTCPYAAKKHNSSPFNNEGKYTVADAKAAKQVQAAGPQRGTY